MTTTTTTTRRYSRGDRVRIVAMGDSHHGIVEEVYPATSTLRVRLTLLGGWDRGARTYDMSEVRPDYRD